jgi:phage tail-like protein
MANIRSLPWTEFAYLVYLDWPPGAKGVLGGFAEIAGLSGGGQLSEYRPGNGPIAHPIGLGGASKVSDVTLKRGVVNATSLWNWIAAARTNRAAARIDATITLRDETGRPVQSWKLKNAAPVRYIGPPLNGKGSSDVAIESLELSPENVAIVPPQ